MPRIIALLWLIGCSGAPQTPGEKALDTVRPVPHDAPVITFVLSPSSASASQDGQYTLGFAVSYTDDTEPVTTLRFEGNGVSSSAVLPTPEADGPTPVALTLPPGMTKGAMSFALRVVSQSGVASAPYADIVMLE
jgi:hypothetical protein